MSKQAATMLLDGGCATHREQYRDMPLFAKPKHSNTELGFDTYDLENPQVWTEFERITLQLIAGGSKHYGAKAVFEIIRFNTAVTTAGAFKLNNDYTAHYARKFARQYPEHKGFFEQRERKHV